MRSQIRAGFTLVELMVAMALTMFIMVILSQAFVISLETFAALKGIGDMQEKLRSANVILRHDLTQDHFDGNLRLSDLNTARKPLAGFFAVLQGSTPVTATSVAAGAGYVREGRDANNMDSFRATNQVLYMTVKRKGNRTGDFFTAPLIDPFAAPVWPAKGPLEKFFSAPTAYNMLPVDLANATQTNPYQVRTSVPPDTYVRTGFYSSQWAEVIYYLESTGSTEEPNNPGSTLGTPMFSLMRAQFVMVPEGSNVSGALGNIASGNLAIFQGMSCNAAGVNLNFYSPGDAAAGQRVVPSLPLILSDAATQNRVVAAKTLVMPNVTSFHIQIMPVVPGPTSGYAFTDILALPSAGSPRLYDTALFNSGATYTNNFGLKGIQITLRVFEPKTRQTRQMTIVQDF